MAEINPDGVSIKGCTYIYAPKGQAGEYAPLAANPYRGCGHGCAYCYVPLVTKQPRPQFDAGAVERKHFRHNLVKDAQKYEDAGITEQVMLSFTTDPYHPGDTSLTRVVLETLASYGMGFCTLTKGGHRALRDIKLFRPEYDAFATTLTTLDDDFSRKWERNAALPRERIATLAQFYEAGIFTWVSLEPTLDVEASLAIVSETHSFVQLYKIGRANYLKEITKTTDWRDYTLRMIDLCQKLGVQHYIKKDLQEYLPPDYYNPLRIPQHHGPR
jgi:DNA repair photolyase